MMLFLSVLVAIGLFVSGFILGRLTIKKDGLFIVDDSDDETIRWIIDVQYDPKIIPDKKEIRLKVVKMNEEDV